MSRLRKRLKLLPAAVLLAATGAYAGEAQETAELTTSRLADRLEACLSTQPQAFNEHFLLGQALLDRLEKPARAPAPPKQRMPPPRQRQEPGDMPHVRVESADLPAELLASITASCLALAVSPDRFDRLTAAELLGWCNFTNLPQQASALLKDEFWPVRERAIFSLGRLPAGENLELLSELAKNISGRSWRERTETAKALGEAGAALRLLPLLEDPEPEVRLTAAYQFLRRQNHGPDAEKALRKALDRETNPQVRAQLEAAVEQARPKNNRENKPAAK